MIVKQTKTFSKWFTKLDNTIAAVIWARLYAVSRGTMGLWRSVGQGVSELKIDFGPGYRLYFTRRGNELILLLVGGDKRRQDENIKQAQKMAQMPIEECTDFFEVEDENA